MPLTNEQSKWFLEMEYGKDAVNVVEMITKNLKYYIILDDKAVPGFEWIDSNSEKNSVGKLLSNSISCYRKIFRERQSIDASNFMVVLFLKTLNKGRARWLKPVIPALWEAEAGGSQGQQIETILVNMVKPRLY